MDERDTSSVMLAELARSDRETEGAPVLPPGSRAWAIDTLKRLLVNREAIFFHGYQVRKVHGAAYERQFLSEEDFESIVDGRLDDVDDAMLASILLSTKVMLELHDEIKEETCAFWQDVISREAERMEEILSDDDEETSSETTLGKGPSIVTADTWRRRLGFVASLAACLALGVFLGRMMVSGGGLSGTQVAQVGVYEVGSRGTERDLQFSVEAPAAGFVSVLVYDNENYELFPTPSGEDVRTDPGRPVEFGPVTESGMTQALVIVAPTPATESVRKFLFRRDPLGADTLEADITQHLLSLGFRWIASETVDISELE